MKVLLTFLIFTSFLFAKTDLYSKYDDIFKKYEKEFGISYFLMKSIAITENSEFNPHAIMYNSNGTKDIGLMQINTAWIKWMPEANITVQKLNDPEFNIKIAFMIVDKIIERHGYSWDSIGRYHSGTNKFKQKWLSRIKSNIKYLASIDNRITIVASNDKKNFNF